MFVYRKTLWLRRTRIKVTGNVRCQYVDTEIHSTVSRMPLHERLHWMSWNVSSGSNQVLFEVDRYRAIELVSDDLPVG